MSGEDSKTAEQISAMKLLSPKRNTTTATSVEELVAEQLNHFGIQSETPFGKKLSQIAERLYHTQADITQLWQQTLATMHTLDRSDRIAYFNAKKFLSFQLAKLLDSLQHPFRHSYQQLKPTFKTQSAKGPYPVFDNVTAIFSATPVIARTATYIYACAEWIEDAFKGKELLLEIYSRLLNPTSVSLANFVVDLEAGEYADEYFAWNFNSGMAAIDGVLSHTLGRDDVVICSRNIYGGAYQLIHDWYAKAGNLEVAVETFDGYTADAFLECYKTVKQKYADRLAQGRKIYLYLESPCNPHGYVLDLPSICRAAHEQDVKVMVDATVGTPFLVRPLQCEDPQERPDFIIHSYTKDMSGTGSVIAGVVIGRNEEMFIPKGQSVGDISWDNTMFWNVYYVKGAFLNADAAFEVIQGMRTLQMRMFTKCINTVILAKFLDAHPQIQVHCNALEDNPNGKLRDSLFYLGLPAPLFTIDMQQVPTEAFQRFFDSLSPTFGHMISLGQSNTIVSCPALTTHSELNSQALREGGMTETTIRFAIGDEDPADLIAHFIQSAKLTIDPLMPGFSDHFPTDEQIDSLIRSNFLQLYRKKVDSLPEFSRDLE